MTSLPTTNLAVLDIDNNGNNEVLAMAEPASDFYGMINYYNNYKTYIWEFDGESSVLEWPLRYHDSQHTGCYDCELSEEFVFNSISKLVNLGTERIEARVIMNVQKLNDGSWIDVQNIVNERYFVNPLNFIYLGDIWNSKDVRINEIGNYRIYAAVVDDKGNVLYDSQGDKLEAFSNFMVQ